MRLGRPFESPAFRTSFDRVQGCGDATSHSACQLLLRVSDRRGPSGSDANAHDDVFGHASRHGDAHDDAYVYATTDDATYLASRDDWHGDDAVGDDRFCDATSGSNNSCNGATRLRTGGGTATA